MPLQLGSSVVQGQGSVLQGCRSCLPAARQPLSSASRHAAPTRCAAFQPFSGAASRRPGISSPSLTQRRPLSRQQPQPTTDRHVAPQAELIFDYW